MGWLVVGTIIIVPLIEIAVFVKVAGMIGLVPAIAIAIIAGVAGIAMVRQQGFATMQRMRQALDRGEPPVREVFDGACLMIAGGLLLLPGLVSDVFALLLVLPPVRAALRSWLGRHLKPIAGNGGTADRQPRVIEAEFEVLDDKPPRER